MDYGRLVSDAWRLTWRHKFLWILGLFATTSVGSCSSGPSSSAQWRTDSPEVERVIPGFGGMSDQFGLWIGQNFSLVTTIALVAVMLGVAFFVISLIAQGAMAQATIDLAQGRSTSLRQAWDTGLRLFWRYLVLWLILLALTIAVGILVAVIGVGMFFGAAMEGSSPGPLAVLVGIMVLVGALAAIPIFIAFTIVIAYAQRAIAMENVGGWDALGRGFALLGRRLGTSLLVWLISMVLSIAVAVFLGLLAIVLLVPLGGVGALLYVSTGGSVNAPVVAYSFVASVVFVLALWLTAGVANTYFWNLWTLAYLHLTGRMAPTPPLPSE